MLVFLPGTHVGMRNGKFHLSANIVMSNLDGAKLPRDLAQKLYKIAKHSNIESWRKEAAYMLCCLSGNFNNSVKQTFFANRDDIREVVDLRFTSTLERKANNKANRFRNQRLSDLFEQYAHEMVNTFFPFEVD
jgi:hypothetical protein